MWIFLTSRRNLVVSWPKLIDADFSSVDCIMSEISAIQPPTALNLRSGRCMAFRNMWIFLTSKRNLVVSCPKLIDDDLELKLRRLDFSSAGCIRSEISAKFLII